MRTGAMSFAMDVYNSTIQRPDNADAQVLDFNGHQSGTND